MNAKRKRITLDIHHDGPAPAPDHFLRSRTKSGGRFYLVESVRQVKRRTPSPAARYVITVFEVDAATWAKRDPEQGTHFFNWYPRKATPRNRCVQCRSFIPSGLSFCSRCP